MYFLILLLPFLNFITTNLFGRFIGILGASVMSPFAIALCFAISLFAFVEVALYDSIVLLSFCNWIDIELFVSG
jgi:hypothetical protein